MLVDFSASKIHL